MTTLVAAAIGIVLFAIGLLHAYWGFGGVWPGTDPRSCARAVVGFKGIATMPPPRSAFAVTLALFIVAWAALTLGGLVDPPGSPLLPMPWLGLLCAAVFLARGIAGYTARWRSLAPEMPFARYDVRFYSPLCLAIGAGLVFLSLKGLRA